MYTHNWAQSTGIGLASRCCLCNNDLESTPHLLFHCPFAFANWNWILSSAGAAVAGTLSPSEIWCALSQNSDKLACKGAAAIFFNTTFVIWKSQNDLIFHNSRVSQTKVRSYLIELLSISLRWVTKPFSGGPLQNFCHYLFVLD